MSTYKLGDIIDITSSKRIYRSEYVDDGIPFYRSKEIIEHYNYKPVSTELYITENRYDEIKSKFGVPKNGDILITSVGSLGIPYLVSGDFDFYFKDGNLIWFRNFSEIIDSKFFFLWVQSHDGKSRFKQSQIGTSQPAYTIANIKKIEIPLPPLPTQKRIADILSAYDDLIENNNRRIALLEQAARHLYKEWFVRFKFPGHEKVKVVDGVPEGWERNFLKDLCVIGRGASPRPINDYMNGTVPWFKISDATASHGIYITDTKELVTEDGAKKSMRLQPFSLILSNSATCGIPYFTGIEGCIHDGWLYFKDYKDINDKFLFCFLFEKQRELLQKVGDGSVQKNLNTGVVGDLEVVYPKQSLIMDIFKQHCSGYFQQIFSLTQQNILLKQAKERLLPRLMNGAIQV